MEGVSAPSPPPSPSSTPTETPADTKKGHEATNIKTAAVPTPSNISSVKPAGEDVFPSYINISLNTFLSPMVQLVMGAEETVLHVNEEILLRCPRLANALQSNPCEPTRKRIKYEKHDAQTASRLVTWLLSSDYSMPKPQALIFEARSQIVDEDLRTGVEDPDSTKEDSKLKNVEQNAALTGNKHLEDFELDLRDEDEVAYTKWARKNPDLASSMCHLDSLFAHAKLHIFAQDLALPELQRLTSERLRIHLRFIGIAGLNEVTRSDLIKVAKYIYANTSRGQVHESQSGRYIRKQLSQFIGDHYDSFQDSASDTLMMAGGELAADIMERVRTAFRRLKEGETKLKRKAEDSASPAPAKRTAGKSKTAKAQEKKASKSVAVKAES